MAGASTNGFQNGASFYDINQQELLLAALASENQDPNNLFSTSLDQKQQPMSNSQFPYGVDSLDPSFFTSPQQATPSSHFNNIGVDESPFADYLDGRDNSFDYDNADSSDLMIGALPGDNSATDKEGEQHETSEKRKSPDDDDEDAEGGGKRREGEDKTAKKPGRKPLTSEPTTKRKAQNRAAQRAFRERKEKHLKDLETKVAELEKASDAANHENGLLRAQVQRLQTELREYRKRLSLNSASLSRSPPLATGFSGLLGGNTATNNFQFDFPRFGGLPGSHILDNGSLSKASNKSPSASATPRQNSTQSMSSRTNDANGSVQRSGSLNGASGGASPALPSGQSSRGSTDSARIFQFHSNSGSSTNSDSPASSNSQLGQSSCATSPEPSHNSPQNAGDALNENGYICHGNSEGEITFCEKLNMACGNPRNPIPRALSQSNDKPSPAASTKPTPAPASDVNGIDFFANQNGGQFDPSLFGDYRDTQSAVVCDGDFTGGFFNEAFPIGDFSPFHFGDTPGVQKPNPLEEIEKAQEGDNGEDEMVPGEDPSQLLNCHKIWDKLSHRPDFKDGTIDIDNLCSELRAKARCSESGVVVDHKDVEAALERLPVELQ